MRHAHRALVSVAVSAAAILLFASSAWAQTTGRISGVVKDESGTTVPGVVIEAKGPALQGSRATTSGTDGRYRLTLLPPGVYTLSFTLQEYNPESRAAITVSLDKETRIDAVLHRALREEVKVVGEAIGLDTTTTTLATNLAPLVIESLPTGRNYSSIVQVAPGVSSDATPENKDQASITVYGSSGAENAFYIDGVNTTNMEYGFQGKELNYEFVQEIDVKTGGYEAEYGKATGGIVNVITKSGGNEFHGDAFGYRDDDSLQRSARSVVSTGGTVEGFTRRDYGADVGGYIIKDKLWFFGAYDRVGNTTKNALDVFSGGVQTGTVHAVTDSTRELGSAKLTWRVSPTNSLIATYFQDPRNDTGAINDANHTLNGDPLTYAGKQEFGGRDYALRYEGTFGTRWVLSGQVARHSEENSVGPVGSEGDIIEYLDLDNNSFQTGGFGLIQEKTFHRKLANAAASVYLGSHVVKFGVEYEKEDADVIKRFSGGQQVDFQANPVPGGQTIYIHHYWTTPDATVANAPVSALSATPEHKNTTLFVQDRWSVLPNVNISAGVRWDRQEIIDASGERQIDLKKSYAPRLGVIWDPQNDQKTKLFASYGRFYEQLPMDLVIRSFSFERQPRIVNFSPTDNHPDPVAETQLGTPSAILGGFTEPSDPNLRGQYINEYILGGEREVMPYVSVGIKGIYRRYGEVIEDFLCKDDGTYCIGNPGEGIMKRVFTLDYSRTFPAPRPKRRYRGLQIDATKRLSHRWQGLASYIYSKLDGNYDGEYAPFTNVGADPNISAAYDYYDFFTNGSNLNRITNRGNLSNDRRHQFKASGVYITPFKVTVGLSAYFRTGTPLTRYGYSDAYGRYEFFLTPRGGEGRAPSTYEMDVHLGYPLEVRKVVLNFMLDVFNVLNAQRPVLLDQRWGFSEADNASPTPVNPGYGEAVIRTPPTTLRLGLRVSY